MPQISPEDFIEEMEGCIKKNASTIDPLKLKEIWKQTNSRKRFKK
jgi:hypothetical protein